MLNVIDRNAANKTCSESCDNVVWFSYLQPGFLTLERLENKFYICLCIVKPRNEFSEIPV
jgi:hypothetical protein